MTLTKKIIIQQISIGELAKQTGCHIETIRYYEKIALLDEAERTSGNQRRYNQSHYNRLLFILHARELGFSIESIRQLIKLSKHPEQPCGEADHIALNQLQAVRQRISRLKLLEKELVRMTKNCENHTIHDCRVIETLATCGKCTDNNHHKMQ